MMPTSMSFSNLFIFCYPLNAKGLKDFYPGIIFALWCLIGENYDYSIQSITYNRISTYNSILSE